MNNEPRFPPSPAAPFSKNPRLLSPPQRSPAAFLKSCAEQRTRSRSKSPSWACGGRGFRRRNQALKADKGTVLVAMADAFPDRLETSLNNLRRDV